MTEERKPPKWQLFRVGAHRWGIRRLYFAELEDVRYMLYTMAGVFILLSIIASTWKHALLLSLGLFVFAFVVLGVGIALKGFRCERIVDRRRRIVRSRWPCWKTTHSLSGFDRVVLGYEAREATTKSGGRVLRATYPICLNGNAGCLQLCALESHEMARATAGDLAAFLHFPVFDAIDAKTIHAPKPLQPPQAGPDASPSDTPFIAWATPGKVTCGGNRSLGIGTDPELTFQIGKGCVCVFYMVPLLLIVPLITARWGFVTRESIHATGETVRVWLQSHWALLLPVLFFPFAVFLWLRRRPRALKNWARSRNLEFHLTLKEGVKEHFSDMGCLAPDSGSHPFHVMRGQWKGRSIWAFDYHRDVPFEGDFTRHRPGLFSAVILGNDTPLEPLYVRPEALRDRVAESAGIDDIDLESGEFSREFYVRAEDRRWAYHVLHPRVMERLLQGPRFTLELGHHGVIAYRDERLAPDDFEAAASLLSDFLDLIPEYVVKQQEEGPADPRSPAATPLQANAATAGQYDHLFIREHRPGLGCMLIMLAGGFFVAFLRAVREELRATGPDLMPLLTNVVMFPSLILPSFVIGITQAARHEFLIDSTDRSLIYGRRFIFPCRRRGFTGSAFQKILIVKVRGVGSNPYEVRVQGDGSDLLVQAWAKPEHAQDTADRLAHCLQLPIADFGTPRDEAGAAPA